MERAHQAFVAHKEELLQKKHVVGCGIAHKEVGGVCTGKPCVTVLVDQKAPCDKLTKDDLVPPVLDEVPTDVIEVGVLRLLTNRTIRRRPAPPGVSIGHYQVSAGTFGAVVYDRETREPLILSNNHVIANETTGKDNRAQIGDAVYQPGPYDGGGAMDQIGSLLRFVPLHLPPPRVNLVDAAIAQPLQPDLINPVILGIGRINGICNVECGDQIWKSGRSTGVTSGEVRAIEATVTVLLSDGRWGRFDNQIVSSPMCASGDSGSLGVAKGNLAFGLLFAGSAAATVYNRIDYVLSGLGVTLTPDSEEPQ